VREEGNPTGKLEVVEGQPLLSGFEFRECISYHLIMTLNPTTTNDPDSVNKELLISSEHDLLDLETDLTQISPLLTENPDLLGGKDVAELLERLNNTDEIAQSMEDKLDVVLKNLDNILAVLDKGGAPQNGEEIDEGLKDSKPEP
jgi:hypothetical protein